MQLGGMKPNKLIQKYINKQKKRKLIHRYFLSLLLKIVKSFKTTAVAITTLYVLAIRFAIKWNENTESHIYHGMKLIEANIKQSMQYVWYTMRNTRL